jgi:hypothetical protein
MALTGNLPKPPVQVNAVHVTKGVWSFSGLVRPRSRPRPRFLKPVPDQMITIEVGFTITPCDLFGGASQRWGEEKRALVKSAMFNGTHCPVGAGS